MSTESIGSVPFSPSPTGLSIYEGSKLLGHFYSVHWKENLLLAATIVGVVCCALTFFTAKGHLFIPFAFLTFACSIGAFIVRDAVYKESFDNCVDRHQKSLAAQVQSLYDIVVRLETSVQRVEDAGGSLATTAVASQESAADIRALLSDFRKETATLKATVAAAQSLVLPGITPSSSTSTYNSTTTPPLRADISSA